MSARNEIITLVTMKPTELKKLDLSVFQAIGAKYSYEEISGIFKNYKPLDNGNKKLVKGILSFSLLPVVTCQQECQGCYDIRSLRYVLVRAKRIVNTILASSPEHEDKLFEAIFNQINRSRTVSAVRIHVGGDFFSARYVDMWVAMKAQNPTIPFYTYTKTGHEAYLQNSGINVVQSRLADGSFNFGPKADITAKAKLAHGIVCPATLAKVPDQFCGNKCKACQTRQDVFFVLH